MKVAHIVEAWAGGIATYVSNLIDHQIKSGYDVTLIADQTQLNLDKRELSIPIIYYESGRSPKSIYKACIQVAAIIKNNSFDAVHAHSTFPGIYTRALSTAHPNVIYTPHAWSFIKRDIGYVKYEFYKFIERRLSTNTRKIVCMSFEEVREGIKAGIAPEKMELLYTGIPDHPAPSKAEVISRHDSDTVINVGFFGRLDYQKGYDNLVRASELLSENVHLHIYGGSVRGSVATELRDESNFRVTHHGWIPHSSLKKALNTVDIVVIPSRWEGFALAPLEAMRAGRGVIVSNTSSLPEVVISGFNGVVLKENTAEGIAETLNALKKSDCIKYSANARIVYEQTFRQELFMNRMDSFYYE